jgi:hypothetical protein
MPTDALRMKLMGLVVVLTSQGLHALPQYTAREGRVCDSCHAYPFETTLQKRWADPPMPQRKCNLSCGGCHVDPGGGGLRTVSGRYLQYAALPIFNNEARPWHDRERNVWNAVDFLRRKPAPNLTAVATPAPAVAVATKTTGQSTARLPAVPPKFHTHDVPVNYSLADPTVYGVVANATTTNRVYSPEFGIYGRLNADPKFQIGGDIRVADVQSKSLNAFFPMQFDLGARYHPVEHWTLAATLGLVGKADTGNQAPARTLGEMWTIRSAYAMYHELPYQMFFRAGFFQPAFGVRLEDHTAPVRQYFEQDLSKKYAAVLGAEVGFMANYPYLTVSGFTNNGGRPVGDSNQNYAVNPQGFGTAINGGWRDLAWGLGGSFMLKSRTAEYSGNLTAASADGYLNLGRFWLGFPMTIIGEYALGQYSGLATAARTFAANFIELNYLAFNGINLKINHHFYDADINLAGDESGRFGFGVELIPITFMKLYLEYRLTWAVDPSQLNARGLVNPFDWLNDKQFIFIGHVYF